MPLDYPHPTELEQRVGLHYKPFRLFRLTPSLAIQPLVRAIFFYLASNPRSRVREDTLSWDRPVLKDPSEGDIIDFYGSCNHDPLGREQVLRQKADARRQRDRFDGVSG